MLLATLFALQVAPTGFEMRKVLALNVPLSFQLKPEQAAAFYKEAMRRIGELPGVEHVAVGTAVPWRDAGVFGPGFQFTVEGYAKANGEDDPRARFRTVSPRFFAALGVPIIAGRDFSDADRRDAEPVVIVSQSVAQRMFPNQDAVNRQFRWTDPVMKFIDVVHRAAPDHSVSRPTWTMRTSCPDQPRPCTTRSIRRSAAGASSSTRARVAMRWCRRSRRSCARSRPTSPSSGPRRSRTSVPRSSRRIG
jgi:hypothetical protein